jgi:hypothetical protein
MSSEAIIGIAFGLSATILSITAIVVSMQTQKYRMVTGKHTIYQVKFQVDLLLNSAVTSAALVRGEQTTITYLPASTQHCTRTKLTQSRTDNSDLELQLRTQNTPASIPSTTQSSTALLTTDADADETPGMRPYALRILEIVSDLSTTRREQA